MQTKFHAVAALGMAALLGLGCAQGVESAATTGGGMDAQAHTNPYIAWVSAHPALGSATAVSWVVGTASARAGTTPFAGDARAQADYLAACAWLVRQNQSRDSGAPSPVVHQLQQMVGNPKLAEGQRFFGARALSALAEDSQSIELVIDAATDLRNSPAYRAALTQQVVIAVYGSILTRAQRKRLESIAFTSP